MQHHTQNRVALVTGAGRGIGQASAIVLLEKGNKVVLTDLVQPDGSQLPASLRDNALCMQMNVCDEREIQQAFAATEKRWGPVEILVNNAGLSLKKADGQSESILEISPDHWAKMLEVNVTAIMRLCQRAIPGMRDRGWGRIVNIASLAGRTKSRVAGPTYMMTKAAVLGLTRSIATEMGPNGITANSIAPGRVLTEMALQAGPEVNEAYAAQIPVRRLGTTDEVAEAVSFLAGELSGFINGAVLDINGGYYMP